MQSYKQYDMRDAIMAQRTTLAEFCGAACPAVATCTSLPIVLVT